MFERSITLALSGHRRYPDSGILRTRLQEALQRYYRRGYRVFLCGMADGFDLCAAVQVLELKKQHPDAVLACIIPFDGHRHTIENVGRYDSVTASTDIVVTLSRRYFNGCYYRRNDFLVDHASALLCYCDGRRSGTRYTVDRARRCGLEVENLLSPQLSL